MSLSVFQWLALVVVVFTLVAMGREEPRRLFADYILLALASYLGEETCIELYGFYHYNRGFFGFIHHVPVMIPLIWPLVILSSRAVVRAISGGERPLWIALLVVFDASLVEVLSVRSGYWSWTCGGHLDVPLIGIIGWGCFVFGAAYGLSFGGWRRVPITLAASFASTHLLLLGLWWGGMRYLPRDNQPWSFALFALLSVLAVIAALHARKHGRNLDKELLGPRLLATGLFFALFALSAGREPRYWAHLLLVAIPYCIASMPLIRKPKKQSLGVALPIDVRG